METKNKRLTIRVGGKSPNYGIRPSTSVDDVLNRLAYYEDKEERGLLIDLPFGFGDTIYRPYKYKGQFISGEVTSIGVEVIQNPSTPGIRHLICYKATAPIELLRMGIQGFVFEPREVGDTVFTTEEEARVRFEELMNNMRPGELRK